MTSSFTIQVRSVLGTLDFFPNVFEFVNFYNVHRDTIAKISFDDSLGAPHRFTFHESGGVFDLALFENCKKVFPIDSLLFIDVPLCLTEEKIRKIDKFCKLMKVDFNEAYDCVCVKNAFTEKYFFEYLEEVESLFVNRKLQYPCECECCAYVACAKCEPANLDDHHHIAPCGKVCFCYDCYC